MNGRERLTIALLLLTILMLIVVNLSMARVAAAEPESIEVRVTYYYWTGNVMYAGIYPFPGAAACSWNLPLYTVVEFEDGREVVCLDRGLLGSTGWIDVYANTAAAGREVVDAYGDWARVRVARWGRE